MSKIASFLGPLLGVGAGATGGSMLSSMLPGLLVSAVGSLGETFAQNAVYDEQQRINNTWEEFQKRKQDASDVEDERNRQQNENVMANMLEGSTQEAREQVIETETDRLYDFIAPEQTTVADALLSGDKFSSENFRTETGKKLATATKEARERIKALAEVSSYGGTRGGMAADRSLAGHRAMQDIGSTNEKRNIDSSTLQRWQSVQPEMLQYQSTGLGSLLSGLGGNMMSNAAFGSTGTPTAPAGFTPTYSAWTPPPAPTRPRPRPNVNSGGWIS